MCKDCGVYLGGGKCSDNCKVIGSIKALEQPAVLDKIRADVINIADGRRSISVRSIVKILDKYKTESGE